VTKIRVSEDALFGGRIKLFQPARGSGGYRVNVDAILLAGFAAEKRRKVEIAVDLGSGVGAVGLSLFHFGVTEHVAFVERDAFLAELCRKNLVANGFSGRGTVSVGDLDLALQRVAPELVHRAGLVVANPPYFASARDGRTRAGGRTTARRQARHGELAPFVRAAADALGKRGRACFVYPAHALLEVTVLARQLGLEPKRLRFVHGKADRPARVALIELAFAKAGGLVVLAPLVETGPDGRPTTELAELLASA
jgi:tRNA1Val (adenine37-N6)-methyltransferase